MAAVMRMCLQALDERRLASTARADSPFVGDAAARPWWDGGADDAPGPADRLLTRPAHQHKEVRQMTEQSPSQYQSAGRAGKATSGWAVGFILFAAIMMIMVGVFQALQGIIAIFENEFYVATRNYTFQFDATTWGWIHLLLGLLVAFAGWGLLSGRTWARVVALTLAALSAIANFLFVPYYPFWSLLLVTLNIFVIWAITAHGGDMRDRV
jgi:hypothetical protein